MLIEWTGEVYNYIYKTIYSITKQMTKLNNFLTQDRQKSNILWAAEKPP